MHMDYEDKIQELHTYLDKWAAELRQVIGLPRTGAEAVGISFLPELALQREPMFPYVNIGIYMSRSNAAAFQVEVVKQAPTGEVVFEMLDDDTQAPRLQLMSPHVFQRLFEFVPDSPSPAS